VGRTDSWRWFLLQRPFQSLDNHYIFTTHSVVQPKKRMEVIQPVHTHRSIQRLWNSCWCDAKHYFGRQRLGVTKRELLHILRKHKVVDDDSGVGMGDVIHHIAVVPRDPSKKISVANSSILTRPQRKMLMKTWNSCRDDDVYRQLLNELIYIGKF
jgi:hypothetical protein